jgi:hypothetical protein
MAREAVALLASGPDWRISMARAARAEWERRFTLEKFHEQLLGAMEEWAGQQATRAGQGIASLTH